MKVAWSVSLCQYSNMHPSPEEKRAAVIPDRGVVNCFMVTDCQECPESTKFETVLPMPILLGLKV
jgi:hypothetical protein